VFRVGVLSPISPGLSLGHALCVLVSQTSIEASMQQEMASRRKRSRNLLPFAVGAFTSAMLLGACERPATQSASSGAHEQQSAASQPLPAADPSPAQAPSPPPPKEALSDTVITGKIKAAILTDPGMAGADVSVNTDRGVVMLAGLVRNPEQTAIASAHAQRQDGVMRVDNHLAVPPT
jgi:osmotically-inducible protein OsmY